MADGSTHPASTGDDDEARSSTSIRAAIIGARQYLSEHPAEARYRDSAATARLEEGLRVRVVGDDGLSTVTDMSPGIGGAGSAPSPAWLFRAAYASCVTTLIAMRSAETGIVLTELTITVDSESDDRGILGIDAAVPAGPLNARLRIRIGSTGADETRLREVVEWGRAHCPLDDLVRRAVPVETLLDIVPTASV